MKKSVKIICGIMLVLGIIVGSFSGCTLVGTQDEETTVYVESVSKQVKEPSVTVEQIYGEKLVIDDGVKEITNEMLNGKSLISIDIPDSVTHIDDECIDKSVVIICNDNSYASEFASENGYWYYLTYETLDENNKTITESALFSDENVQITEAMPCNNSGYIHTVDGLVLKQSTENIINYVNGLVSELRDGKPYIGFSRSYSVDDIELAPIGTEDDSAISTLASAKKQLRNLFLDGAESDEFMPVPENVEWGEDNSSAFTMGEIPMNASYDNDETFSAYCIEIDTLNRITINFGEANNNDLIDGVFGCIPEHDRDEINAEFDKLSAFLTIDDDYTVEYKDCRMYVESDRTNDQVDKIELNRVAYITATATGTGEFEFLGQFQITFKFSDNFTITTDWDEPVE